MIVAEDELKKVCGRTVGIELAEALGISTQNVLSIKIDVNVETATVTIEKFISKKDMEGISSVIQKYAFMEFVGEPENDE